MHIFFCQLDLLVRQSQRVGRLVSRVHGEPPSSRGELQVVAHVDDSSSPGP